MKVKFEPAARDELDSIFAWIEKDNPRAAFEMIARIEKRIMQLAVTGLSACSDEIDAAALHLSPAEVGYIRLRPL